MYTGTNLNSNVTILSISKNLRKAYELTILYKYKNLYNVYSNIHGQHLQYVHIVTISTIRKEVSVIHHRQHQVRLGHLIDSCFQDCYSPECTDYHSQKNSERAVFD